jgi:hypothetical protein
LGVLAVVAGLATALGLPYAARRIRQDRLG